MRKARSSRGRQLGYKVDSAKIGTAVRVALAKVKSKVKTVSGHRA